MNKPVNKRFFEITKIIANYNLSIIDLMRLTEKYPNQKDIFTEGIKALRELNLQIEDILLVAPDLSLVQTHVLYTQFQSFRPHIQNLITDYLNV